MKEQSTDILFDSLVRVLMQDLGFYIPSAIIINSVIEELGENIPEGFLDNMFILDINLGMGSFELEEFNQRLLKKKKLLEQNIFKLLRKKGELNEIEFIYIIEKYLDQIAFYIFITNWLKTNLRVYNESKINIAIIGAFEIQYGYFKNHLKEFTRCFGSLTNIGFKRSFNAYEIVKDYIPDMMSKYELITEENIENKEIDNYDFKERIIENDNYKEKSAKTNKNEHKKPLFSEKEIEEFLLESVFDVKLK